MLGVGRSSPRGASGGSGSFAVQRGPRARTDVSEHPAKPRNSGCVSPIGGSVPVLCSKSMTQSLEREVTVRYRIPGFSERWTIPEGTVPETAWHYERAEQLRTRAARGLERAGRLAIVYRNLAIRVREDRPQIGFDPDICVVEPPPPEAHAIESLKLWLPEHHPPRLVVELVSQSHPTKDYVEVPDACAAIGVEELVLFDPTRAGPRAHGGGSLVQIWRRGPDGGFERVSASDASTFSIVLGAWLIPNAARRELLIADDPSGLGLWPTSEELAQTERAEKEAALRRVAALEAELSKKR